MSSPDEISRIREENFERAVDAIKRDDVDALKDALDAFPEINTVVNERKQNLLHLSCVFRKKKVFDYLLSLHCFDLEAFDSSKHNVLTEALYGKDGDDFGVKLIKAGADVFRILHDKKTYLHYAISNHLLESAELLLQKGLDPNAEDKYGYTPLHLVLCCLETPEIDESVDLLLQYGADTAIYDKDGYLPFDLAVNFGKMSIQEHLFYCTFDSHSADYEMQSDVLTTLLDAPLFNNVSPLFDNVMDVVSDVVVERYYEVVLFTMPPDLLKKIVQRYGFIIKGVFLGMESYCNTVMHINSLETLLNGELHFETVELISTLNLWKIYSDNHCMSQEERSSLILYLLSYGLNVTSSDCQEIYWVQGYSDLFKTMLLHLNYANRSQISSPIVKIIADINCDLNNLLARMNRFTSYQIEPLLDYFANSELRLLCERTYGLYLIDRLEQLPTVPSLLQLARDETRRHIVRRYNLQKTSQYYWVLRRLGIGTTYEEILSFETKLY